MRTTKNTIQLSLQNFCRPGLSARQPLFGSNPPDQLEINIEAGNAYELDDDIDSLRESVGRLKQVSSAIEGEAHLTKQIMDGLVSSHPKRNAEIMQGLHVYIFLYSRVLHPKGQNV